MRDETTGRHAAAVASYATALAQALGCSEDECDIVRAAGLLHEIGKFTWPDRVLHAERVEDEDMAIVRSHPQEGAILVGALDGYGPVADAILYHHERMDGRGYPAGLIGTRDPADVADPRVCSIYDTMVSRESYRGLMSPAGSDRGAARGGQERPARPGDRRGLHRVCSSARATRSPRTADFERRTRIRAPRARHG